jgi:hypothetical protein
VHSRIVHLHVTNMPGRLASSSAKAADTSTSGGGPVAPAGGNVKNPNRYPPTGGK